MNSRGPSKNIHELASYNSVMCGDLKVVRIKQVFH